MPYSLAWEDRQSKVKTPAQATIDPVLCNGAFFTLSEGLNNLRLQVTNRQFTKIWSAALAGAELLFPDDYADILLLLLQASSCPIEDENQCFEFKPSAPFINFVPDNPYISGDTSPGWNKEAWFQWQAFDSIFPDWIDTWLNGAIEAITGYQAGDILFNIESIPINPIDAFLNGGGILPKIEIQFAGTGSIDVTLLSFPLGGKCVIEIDQEPNVIDILTGGILDPGAFLVELNRDIFNFPPDEYPVVQIPLEITDPGNHTLYIVFIPIVDDQLLPVGFGGGIRSIEFCGFEEVPMPGIEQLFFEDCTLKAVVNGTVQEVQNFQDLYDCIEALMATKAEIKEAIIESAEQLAAQLISGTPDNIAPGGAIEINDKGEIAVKSGGIAPDDPTTSTDEERRSGGANAVYLGFRQLILDINSWITAGYEADEINFLVGSKYIINGQMLEGITAYRSNFLASPPPAGWSVPVIGSALASYIYCRGNTRESIAKYILANWDAEIFNLLNINNGLDQAQLDAWFAQGEQIRSTDYVSYSCVPIDPEEFDLTSAEITSGAFTLGIQIGKINHRILIEVSGKVTHPTDGSYQDFFYHVASNGVKTFLTSFTSLGQIQFNAPFSNPPQTKIPFEESGVYSVTMETTSADIYAFRRQIQVENFGSGSYEIKFTDLGEVIA